MSFKAGFHQSRRRLSLLSTILVAFGGTLPAAQSAEVTGAGSTFVYPILSKWAEGYRQKTDLKINYQSIGSGGGIAQIKKKTVDFGASDAPLTSAQSTACTGCIEIPWAHAIPDRDWRGCAGD